MFFDNIAWSFVIWPNNSELHTRADSKLSDMSAMALYRLEQDAKYIRREAEKLEIAENSEITEKVSWDLYSSKFGQRKSSEWKSLNKRGTMALEKGKNQRKSQMKKGEGWPSVNIWHSKYKKPLFYI